jgi:hypothetical protein
MDRGLTLATFATRGPVSVPTTSTVAWSKRSPCRMPQLVYVVRELRKQLRANAIYDGSYDALEVVV